LGIEADAGESAAVPDEVREWDLCNFSASVFIHFEAIGAILLARSWVAWREGGARDAGYLIMEMRGSWGWACE
jgi:hypothetical protein